MPISPPNGGRFPLNKNCFCRCPKGYNVHRSDLGSRSRKWETPKSAQIPNRQNSGAKTNYLQRRDMPIFFHRYQVLSKVYDICRLVNFLTKGSGATVPRIGLQMSILKISNSHISPKWRPIPPEQRPFFSGPPVLQHARVRSGLGASQGGEGPKCPKS